MSQRKRRTISFGLTVGIVAICIVMLFNINQSPEITNVAPTIDVPQLIRPYSPMLGQANAKVTIVEFLDPENPGSYAAYSAVSNILGEFRDQVRLVVRYFPQKTNSALAVSATEAAGEQGKYWEMLELLFDKQSEWGDRVALQSETFKKYAEQLELNLVQFIAAFEKSDYSSKIDQDRADGLAFGVTDTPTLFVNGNRLENLTLGGLRQLVQEQI